jgi:hypothetical protein
MTKKPSEIFDLKKTFDSATKADKEKIIEEIDELHAECNIGCSLSSYEIEVIGNKLQTLIDKTRKNTLEEERERINSLNFYDWNEQTQGMIKDKINLMK